MNKVVYNNKCHVAYHYSRDMLFGVRVFDLSSYFQYRSTNCFNLKCVHPTLTCDKCIDSRTFSLGRSI